MKSKKVYIGILAIALFFIICVCASIFYIKTNNKDVEIAEFVKNFTNENTKEAMETTEEVKEKSKKIEEDASEQSKPEVKENEGVEKVEENIVKEEVEKKKENIVKEEVKKKEETPKKEFVVTPVDKKLYVNTNSLNVRSGPDTTYSQIGGLKKAAEVKVTGQVSGWYRISYNGKVGYVKASYLSETKPVVEEPTIQVSNEPVNSNSNNKTLNNLIIINSRNNTLRYYLSGKLSRSYSCATGASSSPTPQGKFLVSNKIVNRPYYKANIPGGDPRNPLGKRWIGLDVNGTKGSTYGIHGTNNEGSIGSNASHGCVRMHNADVESFYEVVPIGTTVIIKNTSQSDKEIAASYDIFIE